MIAVDTSAIVAILLQEDDAFEIADFMEQNAQLCMSAGTLVELHRVAKGKKGLAGQRLLIEMLGQAEIEIIAVTPPQAQIAIDATWSFPILNYGDVFAYALAKERDIPLLFKGNDFTKTDIVSAR